MENFSINLREELLTKAILSISGWRHTFGLNSFLEQADKEFIITSAFVIGEYFQSILSQNLTPSPNQNPSCFRNSSPHNSSHDYSYNGDKLASIVIARDSRVTGKAICEIFLIILKKYFDFKIHYLDISAIPQVLSFTQSLEDNVGFIYISASHNPPEYNGIKIGNHRGEVLPQEPATQIIKDFKKKYLNEKISKKYLQDYNNITKTNPKEDILHHEYFIDEQVILNSKEKYQNFIKTITTGFDEDKQNEIIFDLLKDNIKKYNLHIFYDYNGSARLNTIDRELLTELDINVESFNDEVGHFAHEIIPEGESLSFLRDKMKGISQKEGFLSNDFISRTQNVLFGVLPDCDGDRGNFVFYEYDKKNDIRVYVPDAQTVFALTVLAEVCYTVVWLPEKSKKMTVVANDPTSLKINYICEKFDIDFVQAEVGEANVLALAKEKEEQGDYVRIIGEGSNGGSILLPSRVRDPLISMMSLLKLLFLPNPNGDKVLIDIAFQKLGINSPTDDDFQKSNKSTKSISPDNFFSIIKKLDLICKHLQRYQSTSMASPEAMIRFSADVNQEKIKHHYEKIFALEYEEKKEDLADEYNIYSYQILNYLNTKITLGPGNRDGNESGGFKIVFLNQQNQQVGFLWIRSSKTEPLFRLSSEIEGSKDQQEKLLAWHREMLEKSAENSQSN